MHGPGATVRVKHREFIQDLLVDATGKLNTKYYLQPGDSSTFPWLHQLASNFQEYRIHGMVYYYRSLIADSLVAGSTVQGIGQIIIATDYNVLSNGYAALPFPSKAEMQNTQFTQSSKLSGDCMHIIECDPAMQVIPSNWIRTSSNLPTNADARLYDMAKTQILVEATAPNQRVGELWVSYDIELRKPILSEGNDQETIAYALEYTAAQNSWFPSAGTLPFVGSAGTLSFPTSQSVQLPLNVTTGKFCLVWQIQANGVMPAYIGAGVPAYQNCQALTPSTGIDNASYRVMTSPVSAVMIVYFEVVITNPQLPVIITFPNPAWGGNIPAGSEGYFILNQLDSDIVFPDPN